jgi:hypothetical protein
MMAVTSTPATEEEQIRAVIADRVAAIQDRLRRLQRRGARTGRTDPPAQRGVDRVSADGYRRAGGYLLGSHSERPAIVPHQATFAPLGDPCLGEIRLGH